MATDIMVIAFELVVIVIFLILALMTGAYGYSFFGFLLTLFFVAAMITGNAQITISSFYNSSTSTIIPNNIPAYPIFVIAYFLLIIIQIIITIKLVTIERNNDEVYAFS